MADADRLADDAVDLSTVSTLIVDQDRFTRSLVVQMLRSFAMPEPTVADNAAAAQAYLKEHPVELCICESVLPDMTSAMLIHWIRRHAPAAMRAAPVIVLTGHTRLDTITDARDNGASFVVKKPISARVLHDRILWATQSQRPFVIGGGYPGPDRRFRNGAPPRQGERRLSALSEDEIEGLDGSERDRVISAAIAAIEASLVECGGGGLTAPAQDETLRYGARIATLSRAAGYRHLEGAARGLCDVAAGLDPADPRGTAPVAVHLQAMQLLAPGNEALTRHGADRVLGALTRMLAHLGIEACFDDPIPEAVNAP